MSRIDQGILAEGGATANSSHRQDLVLLWGGRPSLPADGATRDNQHAAGMLQGHIFEGFLRRPQP